MIARLKFLEKAQWWDQAEITAWQEKSLAELLQTAYGEVPFYRNLFDQAGITPQAFHSANDLQQLPIVSKDMLRQGYPDLTTRRTGQKTYQVSTSGSTGKNFYVREDAYTAGWYRAAFMLSLEWAGWEIGQPHLQTGMTLERSLDRRLKDLLLGCHYVSAYNLDDRHLDEILAIMEKYHIGHLWGYPGSLYYLARRAAKQGWNRPLKAAVTWGDMLYPQYRKEIESAFQTRVFDTYGCAEGFQISAQCEAGYYHLHSFDTIVEFLDADNRPVPAGETGNIIVTRLHPGPMPFIRYAVGDLGIPSEMGKCPCGRGFPLMHSIQGRNVDVIETPSGNRLIVHYFTGILEHFSEIDTFQVIQSSLDCIDVNVVLNCPPSEAIANKIIQAIQAKGASDLKITVHFAESIPLHPSGKHKFIIRKLD